MSHRLVRAFVGSLLVLSCCAGTAAAAGPAPVKFRVEGPSGTLVPETSLTTNTTPVKKDGTNACSGTSATGALEQGTAGDWTAGPYSQSYGYFVNSIRKVAPGNSNDYWTLWVNDKSSQTGICDTELQAQDRVLFFICKSDPVTFNCSNTPLGVQAPATARTGSPFSVKVVQFDGNGGSTPVVGATVSGGSASAVTGPDGRATVQLDSDGTTALLATKPGATRSAPAAVCASAGNDGTCGTADTTPPRMRIGGIKEGQAFAAGHGPRTLRGSVGIDSSGLRDVALRISRRVGGRCYTYSSRKERFVRRSCRAPRASFFSITDRKDWSYLLPTRLPAGRYVFDAVATDKNGNRSHLKLGVSRVVFRVRGKG